MRFSAPTGRDRSFAVRRGFEGCGDSRYLPVPSLEVEAAGSMCGCIVRRYVDSSFRRVLHGGLCDIRVCRTDFCVQMRPPPGEPPLYNGFLHAASTMAR